MVSELLGSFGDNELSPECLDGAQKFLKGLFQSTEGVSNYHLIDGGISIPSAYTSYLAPVSSSKLHNEVRAYNDRKHFETVRIIIFLPALSLVHLISFSFFRCALLISSRRTLLSCITSINSTLRRNALPLSIRIQILHLTIHDTRN